MQFASGWESFHAGSPVHLAVVFMLVIFCALLARRGWCVHQANEAQGRRMDRQIAGTLLTIWVLMFLRDLRPDRIGWGQSLPLHFCDLVGLAAPFALLCRRRWPRNLLYFWGLGVCSQAFVAPVLRAGPAHLDFWLYWIGHGGIISAAVYDVAARGHRPGWDDWRWTVLATSAYMIVLLPIDALMHVNYGYLGNTEHAQRSLVMALGSWPERVPRMLALFLVVTAAMVLPWKRRGENARAAVRITEREDATTAREIGGSAYRITPLRLAE